MLIERLSIKEAVGKLYSAAGIPSPKVDSSCIVPLRHLVGAFGLICFELPDLTVSTAKEFLRQNGFSTMREADSEKTKKLAGFLYVTMNYGCIFVDKNDPVTRRRFSVAHEIGHYLLHFRPILNAFRRAGELVSVHHSDRIKDFGETETDDAGEDFSGTARTVFGKGEAAELLPPYEQMEDEANAFAGELLLPAEFTRLKAATLNVLADDLPRRIADDLLVSRSAVERRLKDLDLLQK